MRLLSCLLTGALGLVLAVASPARAEEGAAASPKREAPAGPSMILQLLNRQSEVGEFSLRESLRPDVAPVPAARLDGPERMPDGSIRYGRTRVNVKVNDCPDDPSHEQMAPPPVPVRRVR